MKPIALCVAGLLLSATSQPEAKDCQLVLGEAVPNAETAKQIANAVIANRQSPQVRAKYRLNVEPDEEQPDGWIVFQSLHHRLSNDPNTTKATRGGGGIGMRIDRCTGEISNMYFQR